VTAGAREANAFQAIRAGAFYGGAVWAIYGIVETAAVVSGPFLKAVLPAPVSRLFPSLTSPFNSPALTAFVLSIYPMAGAAIGAALAVPVVFSRLGRRISSDADTGLFWSAVNSLALALAFFLNALVGHQMAVIPAVLAGMAPGALRLAAACRVDLRTRWRRWLWLTSPATTVLILVGLAFIAQPRRFLPPLVPVISGLAYVTIVLFLRALLRRVWIAVDLRRGIGRLSPSPAVSIALLSCAALTSTVLTDSSLRVLFEPQQGRTRGRRPNVILITLDTVRADHLSAYGYGLDTTPNLRRLVAARAIRYARSISSSNWTLPSHASIFTGQNAAHSGARDSVRNPASVHPISPASVTLPELLSQQGYRTAAIVANTGVLTPALGFARGFSSFDGVERHDFFSPTGRPYLFRESVRVLLSTVLAPERREAVNAPAGMITERASRFLESGSQPFFLFLNYLDAHVPYAPPAPFDNRYAGKDPRFRWADYDTIVDVVNVRHLRPIDARESAHLISQYDGAISYVDSELGQLFQRLKSLGLFENSLIIITSDHGEAFGENSVVGHRVSLYQHQIHVPLIVKYPYATTGATVDELASGIDILPTVLDVIGAPMPPNIDGRSLRQEQPLIARWVTSESFHPRGPGGTGKDERPTEMALLSGTLKLILGAGGGTELYDLSTDPNERENLIGRHMVPRGWISTLMSDMEAAGATADTCPVTDPDVLDRLRALGYIQ
jgi:arylsulfatase A-like enzyme